MKLIENGIYTNGDRKFMILKIDNNYVAILKLDCFFNRRQKICSYINVLLYVLKTWQDHTEIYSIDDPLIKNIDGYVGQFYREEYETNNQ